MPLQPTILPSISETGDLPNSAATTLTLPPATVFEGFIDGAINDRGDFIAVEMEAGRDYRIDLSSQAFDTYLQLYSGTPGNLVLEAFNDDGGTFFLDSRLQFTAPATGTYYLRATYYANWDPLFNVTGGYQLTVSNTPSGPEYGTAADETLTGTFGNDTLDGLTGDDRIDGLTGADWLRGGEGADTILAFGVNSTAIGNGGDDLIGVGSNARVYAGPGNDTLEAHGSFGLLFGGPGQDTITGYDGADQVRAFGGANADLLDFVDAGYSDLYGEGGDDTILLSIGRAYGGNGNDTLQGGDGYQRLSGGDGDDSLLGGAGGDRLHGDAGNDVLLAGTGRDVLFGGDGDDTASGGDGDDSVWGDAGADLVSGDAGADSVGGGAGADTVQGGEGADTVWGGGDNDRVDGGAGDDMVMGGPGDDVLTGGTGNDWLRGGPGSDVLSGDEGDDTMIGDAGDDRFVFSVGVNAVLDFQAGPGGDWIDLASASGIVDFADLLADHLSEVNGNAVISDDAGNMLTLYGVAMADLANGDFLF